MTKYISKAFLVVGDNNYVPGSEIKEDEEICIDFVNKDQATAVEIVEEVKVKKVKKVATEE